MVLRRRNWRWKGWKRKHLKECKGGCRITTRESNIYKGPWEKAECLAIVTFFFLSRNELPGNGDIKRIWTRFPTLREFIKLSLDKNCICRLNLCLKHFLLGKKVESRKTRRRRFRLVFRHLKLVFLAAPLTLIFYKNRKHKKESSIKRRCMRITKFYLWKFIFPIFTLSTPFFMPTTKLQQSRF